MTSPRAAAIPDDGAANGLTDVGNQFWHQDSAGIEGDAEFADRFSDEAVATADFDGDGFADLAVGVGSEGLGATTAAGAVNVIYGSAGGLTAADDQLWHQDSPGIEDPAEAFDFFGSDVTGGDFNGDGFDDLAVGVPREDIAVIDRAGAVNVIYGSGDGLAAAGNQIWHQDSTGILGTAETDDFFGTEVVTGDFNNDRFDDLAISVLLEDIGAATTAGAVNVIYGSAAGLTAAGNQLWHQDSPGVQGTSETGDRLGRALATGDFAGNGFDDLAIGVPEEHIGATEDAGVVNVLYGSASGLTAAGDQLWQQDSTGIEDTAEEGDFFGWSVASGDFDGDGFDELAVGVEREGFDFAPGAGAVNIIHGSAGGLTATGNQFWHQDSDGILDSVEPSDFFGGDVTGGDFDGDGFDDLAVGADQEDIVDVERAGAVSVLYGSGDGLTAAGNQFWHQDSDGIEDTAEAQDQFGSDMAGGDFDDDGFADLAVGVREEDIGGAQNAGAVNVLYGAATVHTPTATPTETVPGTPTSTQTPTPTETVAVAPTSTRTPTPTETVAVAPTSTRTPTPTETVAVAPTATRTPTPTETVAGSTPGDVDCNSTTDAIDAALILQLDVGLINSLACPENGDLSGDGTINAIDAAIVLQCDAGLFDCASLAGRRQAQAG